MANQLGISDIELFSGIVEGIESVSRLITRYTIIENLYLDRDCEAAAGLRECIKALYSAILVYLAKVKFYLTGSSWSTYSLIVLL